ncbi:MAG: fructosamine kinase family protein [Pseudomonadota bacterium]|nr:fructosamine kinase family protein [Pseudomonadota bacterium]
MPETFTKRNTTGYPDALICEAEGLAALADGLKAAGVSAVQVPRVFRVDETALEITAIRAGRASDQALEELGEGLARLHRQVREAHGWGRDNYIGLAPQPNRWCDNWGEFFVKDRLGYQVSRITDAGQRERFEQVLARQGDTLIHWLNRVCDHPSQLHGDLWNGNVMFDASGPWLIDPAVYCGDREADLAMTEMFGGFGAAFYRAYDRAYPRTPEYSVKRQVYNLYHYLNHYNLFGGGYLAGCQEGFATIEAIGQGR